MARQPSELERVAAAGAKVKRARDVMDAARMELRSAILAAHAEGASVRVIARAAGISYARVFQIIHEEQ
jgi:DNA-directed RNA polymerase specialized sigma24 family protein